MKTSKSIRLLSVWLGPIALVAAAACGSPDTTEALISIEETEQLGPTWEEYFATATLVEYDGQSYYRVEGDLDFETEEDLRNHYATLVEEAEKLAVWQQQSNGFEPTFPFPDALRISYCVSTSSFGSNHANVLSDFEIAAPAWERIANVRFIYDSSEDGSCTNANSAVDFAVTSATGISCGRSRLGWPALDDITACDGGQLRFDRTSTPAGNGTFASVLTHELGHVLGFRHEHPWSPDGCSEEPDIEEGDTTGRRLTDYDFDSIMHYPQALLTGCDGPTDAALEPSPLDGVGARSIYGMPAAWHTSAIL